MERESDPLALYRHAIHADDRPLATAIARRIFPWRRQPFDPTHAPPAAQRLLERLVRRFGL